MCRHRSFCASGCPAILLINPSSPFRRSSMNASSNRPSSPRNGNCRFHALPGRDGTTICKTYILIKSHWKTKVQSEREREREYWESTALSRRRTLASHWHHDTPASQLNTPTLLSRSSSFLSHSKSLYLRSTRESFTLNTGRFVCKIRRVVVISNSQPVLDDESEMHFVSTSSSSSSPLPAYSLRTPCTASSRAAPSSWDFWRQFLGRHKDQWLSN